MSRRRLAAEAEEVWSGLVEQLTDPLLVIDPELGLVGANKAAEMLMGMPFERAREELGLADLVDLLGTAEVERLGRLEPGQSHQLSASILVDGTPGVFAVRVSRDVDGRWLVAGRDVTEEERENARLRDIDRFFEMTNEMLSVFRVDEHGVARVVRTNRAMEDFYRAGRDGLNGNKAVDFFAGDLESYDRVASELAGTGLSSGETRVQRDGEPDGWLQFSVRSDAESGLMYLVGRDVTEARQLREELRRLANTDELTGLANRRALDAELDRRAGNPGPTAVAIFDLEGLRDISAAMGHFVADQVLQITTRRVCAQLSAADLIARLRSDELVLVFDDPDPEHVEAVCRRLLGVLAEPITVGGIGHRLVGAIGVVVSETPQSATLLRDADVAAREARRRGGGIDWFDESLRQRLLQRQELERELGRAISERQFVLHYQAIVDLASGRVRGAEALVRWQHPERGLLSPFHFIEAAEETGLIVPLGELILEMGCRQLATWFAEGHDLYLSLNVSARQLEVPGFPALVSRLADEAGVPLEGLLLEVTETAVMSDPESAISTLEQLRAAGARVAVDDFGTGHSSLGYLARLPMGVVKIDRTFTSHCTEPASAAVIAAVVSMGQALGLDVVAEGIEDADQAAELADLGVALAQGFHFHRPESAEGFIRLLRDQAPVSSARGA